MKQTKKAIRGSTFRYFRITEADLSSLPYTKSEMGRDSEGYFIKRSYSDEEVIKAHIPLKKGEKVEEYFIDKGDGYIELMTSKDN